MKLVNVDIVVNGKLLSAIVPDDQVNIVLRFADLYRDAQINMGTSSNSDICVENVELNLGDLLERVNSMTNTKKYYDQTISNYKSELETVARQYEQLKSESDKLKEENARLKKQRIFCDVRLRLQKSHITELIRRNKEANQYMGYLYAHSGFDQDVKDMADEIIRLQKVISEKDTEISKLRTDLEWSKYSPISEMDKSKYK